MQAVHRFFSGASWKSRFQRYVWFFLPLLLCLLIPVTRHFPRLHFLGSPFSMAANQSWSDLYDAPDKYNSAAILKRYPDDLKVRIAHIWRSQSGMVGIWGTMDAFQSKSDDQLARNEAKKLAASRPADTQLGMFQLLLLMYGPSAYNLRIVDEGYGFGLLHDDNGRLKTRVKINYPAIEDAQRGQYDFWVRLAEKQAALEPENAFPLLVAAQLRFQQRRPVDGARYLSQAASRKTYNDHSVEVMAAVLHSYEKVRALSVSEKFGIVQAYTTENNNQPGFKLLFNLPILAANYQLALVKSGRDMEALRLTENLVACGALMRSGTSALALDPTLTAFSEMALYSWRPKVQKEGRPTIIERFRASYKDKDVAVRTKKLLRTHWRLNYGFAGKSIWQEPQNKANENSEVLLSAAMAVWVQGGFVLLVWLIVAAMCYRAIGVPATRRERAFVALPSALLSSGLALTVCWWYLSNQRSVAPWGWAKEFVITSVGVVAFLVPFFLPAVLCSFGTWVRYRNVFRLPQRLGMEMKLSSLSTGLLLYLLPVTVGLTVTGLVLSYVVWVMGSWNGWLPMDLLGWLPARQNVRPPSLPFNPQEPFPLAYFAMLTLGLSVLWLVKWRWLTAPHGRPATHFGVRWYKESLGAYLIILAWVYFGLALLSWPLSRDIEAWERQWPSFSDRGLAG